MKLNDAHLCGGPRDQWSAPAPPEAAGSWGPYFDRVFPIVWTNGFGGWKRQSLGQKIASHLWGLREEQRAAYEVAHGPDPRCWPVGHPGVVLVAQQGGGGTPWDLYPACLRCQWLGPSAITRSDRRLIRRTWRYAIRHEQRCGSSHGHA